MRGVTRHIVWVIAMAAVLGAGSGSPAAADTGDTASAAAAPSAVLAELVQDVGGRGAADSPQRYAYLQRLDGHLQAVAASRLGGGTAASAQSAAERQGVTISPRGTSPPTSTWTATPARPRTRCERSACA